MPRDHQAVTPRRPPRTGPDVVERAHQATPPVEHADGYEVAHDTPGDGDRPAAMLDGICNQVVERLGETHSVSVDSRPSGTPLERHRPAGCRCAGTPGLHDSAYETVEVDELGQLDRRPLPTDRLQIPGNREGTLIAGPQCADSWGVCF